VWSEGMLQMQKKQILRNSKTSRGILSGVSSIRIDRTYNHAKKKSVGSPRRLSIACEGSKILHSKVQIYGLYT